MSRFIKLSSLVINTKYIKNIAHYSNENKYVIDIVNHKHFGMIMFGLNSYIDDYVKICKKDNPEDYKIITKWIDSIDNQIF